MSFGTRSAGVANRALRKARPSSPSRASSGPTRPSRALSARYARDLRVALPVAGEPFGVRADYHRATHRPEHRDRTGRRARGGRWGSPQRVAESIARTFVSQLQVGRKAGRRLRSRTPAIRAGLRSLEQEPLGACRSLASCTIPRSDLVDRYRHSARVSRHTFPLEIHRNFSVVRLTSDDVRAGVEGSGG